MLGSWPTVFHTSVNRRRKETQTMAYWGVAEHATNCPCQECVAERKRWGQPIGYLHHAPGEHGYRVVCPDHRSVRSGAPVFEVNVRPYDARCHVCGERLYDAPTDIELFIGK